MRTIASILSESRTIAVVGLSINSMRASHEVARYLRAQDYHIIPVNPTYAEHAILGERCYASLSEAAAALAPVRIDIVGCFRRAEQILPLAREAILIGARCLWLQLGIVNDEAAALARAAGLDVVMNRCMKTEHASLARGRAAR
jgi:predicted CoA-binding protein